MDITATDDLNMVIEDIASEENTLDLDYEEATDGMMEDETGIDTEDLLEDEGATVDSADDLADGIIIEPGIEDGEYFDEGAYLDSEFIDGEYMDPGFYEGGYMDPGMEMGMAEVKDPLLSSWPFVIGISAAVFVVSIALGALLAKLKIKKGIDLYED